MQMSNETYYHKRGVRLCWWSRQATLEDVNFKLLVANHWLNVWKQRGITQNFPASELRIKFYEALKAHKESTMAKSCLPDFRIGDFVECSYYDRFVPQTCWGYVTRLPYRVPALVSYHENYNILVTDDSGTRAIRIGFFRTDTKEFHNSNAYTIIQRKESS